FAPWRKTTPVPKRGRTLLGAMPPRRLNLRGNRTNVLGGIHSPILDLLRIGIRQRTIPEIGRRNGNGFASRFGGYGSGRFRPQLGELRTRGVGMHDLERLR